MLSLHRWLGLAAGAFLIFSGLTGAVLVFFDEVDRALTPALLTVEPGSRHLPIDTLVANVRAAAPGCKLTDVVAANLREPDNALITRLVCDGTLREGIINPYTGEVLGVRDDNYFVRSLFTLHSSLFLNDWGRAFLFCLAVALVAVSVTGLLSHKRLLESFNNPVRRHLGIRVLLADLHRFVGLAALIFNIVIGASGAWLTYGAVQRLLAGSPVRTMTATPEQPAAIDLALASAARVVPGFEVNWIAMPRSADGPLGFWGQVPSAWLYGPFGTTMNLNPVTGEVISVTDVRNTGWRARTTALSVALHFGNFGGTPVKILWFLAALAPPALAVSGVVMWTLRRRRVAR